MTSNNSQPSIPVIRSPSIDELGKTPICLLQQLKQTSWIDIPGKDQSRCRVITTLLHGNEPSGLMALHKWLCLQITPAVNMNFLIASVETALQHPIFSNRMLPGQADFNRCFKEPFEGQQGLLAQQVIERIAQLNPECIIDIHNTSGTGPSFAVTTTNQFEQRVLARYFCRRMIVTDFRLGSLMEVDKYCSTITIECGGAKDSESENTAFNGINEASCIETLYTEGADKDLEALYYPVRVELNQHVTIEYNEKSCNNSDSNSAAPNNSASNNAGSKNTESNNAESKHVNPNPANSSPANSNPVNSNPANSNPANSNPANSNPANSNPADITLIPDIEHCNYGITPVTKCLGYVGAGGLKHLRANNASGVNQLHKLLREENGFLYPACDLHIFMATTDVTIARSDCLFYAVAANQ